MWQSQAHLWRCAQPSSLPSSGPRQRQGSSLGPGLVCCRARWRCVGGWSLSSTAARGAAQTRSRTSEYCHEYVQQTIVVALSAEDVGVFASRPSTGAKPITCTINSPQMGFEPCMGFPLLRFGKSTSDRPDLKTRCLAVPCLAMGRGILKSDKI